MCAVALMHATHQNPERSPDHLTNRPFYSNAIAQVFSTEVGQILKAINAKQKQMATVCNAVSQLFKNRVDFVGIKANNQEIYIFLNWNFAKKVEHN